MAITNYTSPYSLGDEVTFYLTEGTIGVTCSCCEGDTYIVGKDGLHYQCPKCKGKGYIQLGYEGLTAVGQIIEVDITDDGDQGVKTYYKVKYNLDDITGSKVIYIEDKDIVTDG